jgi:hypothetical protein
MESSLAETRSSVILGTPLYMAPEQADGRLDEVGPGTDVFTLGAMLYEMLTGRPPFPGSTLMEVLDRIRGQEPVPVRKLRSEVPQALETVCEKCLQKEPSRRYASAGALAEDLRRALRGERIEARPAGFFAAVRRWSRRPERIGEAALLSYLAGLTQFVQGTVVVVGILLGWFSAEDRASSVAGVVLAVAPMIAVEWVLGYYTAARSLAALWAGAVLYPLMLLQPFLLLLGVIDTGGLFRNTDPAVQGMVLIIGVMLVSIQSVLYLSVLYLVALNAYYANRPAIRSSTAAPPAR